MRGLGRAMYSHGWSGVDRSGGDRRREKKGGRSDDGLWKMAKMGEATQCRGRAEKIIRWNTPCAPQFDEEEKRRERCGSRGHRFFMLVTKIAQLKNWGQNDTAHIL